jgi:hypothetical protein
MTDQYAFELEREAQSLMLVVLASEWDDRDTFIMYISRRGCLRRLPHINRNNFRACYIQLTNNGKLREINQPPIVQPRRHNSRSQ